MNSTLIKLSALSLALISAAAQADLVLKRGQVIGRDGEIYDGMSPETREVLEAQAEEGQLKSGVVNGSFYMIMDGVVSTVPLATLRNLESDERLELVKSTFSDDAREVLEAEYRNQLEVSRVDELNSEIESELENHQDDMDREVERHISELDDELEREVDDHMREMENEIEREIEDHMHEMENEIEREVENHMEEIEREVEREIENHMEEIEREVEHEVESHMQEIEREVERHSEGHDDDHDEHDDDD